MLSRLLSGTLSGATLLNCFLHHLPVIALFALGLVFGCCKPGPSQGSFRPGATQAFDLTFPYVGGGYSSEPLT